MDRYGSLLATGQRGADAFSSYVHLQWIGFYAMIAFAVISMISVFIYILSRIFGKIRYNRRQERLHRELRAQLEERDELLQMADMKSQKQHSALSCLQDRVDLLDNKLYRVDALNESVTELKVATCNIDPINNTVEGMELKIEALSMIIADLEKGLTKKDLVRKI